MSARISSRVTADRSALAARTMDPLLDKEQGSAANSVEESRITSPTAIQSIPLVVQCDGFNHLNKT